MKYLSIAIMFAAIAIASVFEPAVAIGFFPAGVVGFFMAVCGAE